MTTLLVVTAVTLLVSFFCSLLEAALYSITPGQIELAREQRRFGADLLAKLRLRIDQPIAAILTLNTIANTIGSALAGALAAELYSDQIVGAFAAGLTLLILMFGEIVPKNLGVTHAAAIGPLAAYPILIMIWITMPIVYICRFFTSWARRKKDAAGPSEAEIIMMSRLAADAGQLRAQERRWVENALKLDRVQVGDIMTPRTVVYTLPADLPLTAVTTHSKHWVHSRLPLTEDDDPSEVVGMVYRRDVFDFLARGDTQGTLRRLMKPIAFVPELMKAHHLLDQLISEKKHMVAVANEYGDFVGVVTLEDVLETLLGSEIVDEHDQHADLQAEARRRARLKQVFEDDETPPLLARPPLFQQRPADG